MHRLRHGLHGFCVGLTRTTETMAALLLAFIVIVNFLGVFYRYGLRDPIGWTEEAMRYAVVWATFLAASAALYRGEHMVLNVFENARLAWLRWTMHVVVFLCIGTFCFIVIWKGWPVAWRNWHQVSPTMNLPMFWPYVAVTVGFTLMLLKTVALLLMPPGFAAASFAEESVAADIDPSDT
jgi:TRAP-type C4-dicarboxylate transport system permease small subunit